MQILLIRDKNGCHCRRHLWQINHIKISKPPMLLQKKVRACVIFFRASKICLLPAHWACDLKNFLRRLTFTVFKVYEIYFYTFYSLFCSVSN